MSENVTPANRRRLHGKVASLTRSRPATDPELIAARRQLKVLRIEDVINDDRANTVPVQLDDADIARVVEILRGGSSA